MVRVKICGMRCRADIDLCAAAGVDAVGFIFARGPRCLSLQEATRLTKYVPPFVTSVGVFAGNDEVFVREAMRRCRLDVLQFSGGESPEFCGGFERPTVIVMHVAPSPPLAAHDHARMPDAKALRKARAVALMLDSRSGGKVGGTGIRVDGAVAAALVRRSPLPLILAGGLTPANVAAAVAAVQPWGVDVRSGVERFGAKEPALVEQFVREARRSSISRVAGDWKIAQTAQETQL